METFDLVIQGGRVVTHAGEFFGDIAVRGERIAAIGSLNGAKAGRVIDARGLTVLPGVIDSQVHFREPGGEAKEDLATGSKAAVLGGVTSVFEMPNTNPSTTDQAALDDKLARAKGRMYTDHAFYVGASGDNAQALAELERQNGCAGVKIFMGSSTGNLLVSEDAALDEVLAHGIRRVAVHCEDEARLKARRALAEQGNPSTHPLWRDVESALKATKRIVALAQKRNRRVHILHVTTADEMAFLRGVKDIATVEVTPQHLTLAAPECYAAQGTRAQMNPPIRGVEHQQALWHAVFDGTVDVLGSDHAPHLLSEKARLYPESPSGMPGVQTLLPVMLNHVACGRLSLARLIDLTSAGPQRIFGLRDKGRLAVGWHADFTIVDMQARWKITDAWSASRTGWTPFDGMEVIGRPEMTIIRGQPVMQGGDIVADACGAPIRFFESL